MHTPSYETLALVQSVAPGFVPDEPPIASIKCDLWRGTIEAKPAVAKVLRVNAPVWRWFLEREAALYERFSRTPPPVATPGFFAANLARGVLVLERLPGPALALGRYATHPLDEQTVTSLLELRTRLNAWSEGLSLSPMVLPAPSVLEELRSRLLEDATAPLDWILEGTERCAKLGIFSRDECSLVLRALRLRPEPCFSHGDLLLRNVLRRGEALVPVDWECAGPHHEAWDAALLWVALPAHGRERLEEAFGPTTSPRFASFLACSAWALARELKFRRFSFRDERRSAIVLRLVGEMQQQLSRLRALE